MRQPSEEELKALEAEMEKLKVDDLLLQTIVSVLNLGARKAGLVEGSTVDWPQVKQAIDACRALLPLVEPEHGEELGPVRDALSRLQMTYVRQAGGAAGEAPPEEEPERPKPGEPGPAQRSGRLWVPGQS
jgi:hypothetical protein